MKTRILACLCALVATASIAATNAVSVVIETTKGDITVELDEEKAPVTVKNFLEYVDAKFYDGTVFHRVIPRFMIQGGGFDVSYQQKATRAPIKNEARNGLKNKRGTIAMARTMDIDSATAQFFINTVDNGFLDFRSPDIRGYGYTVFGKVTKGMDVVDQIEAVPTGRVRGMQDVPLAAVVIKTIRREEAPIVIPDSFLEPAPAAAPTPVAAPAASTK